MLQLLSPAGLWALAALSLPLVIHLWRPPPRTVRLGSLRFLESLPRRMHDLRWRERGLLAARLALLALLALLVAGPRWQLRPARGPQRWTLLDPTAAPAGESRQRLQARQSAGDETRALAPGFPVVDRVPAPGETAGTVAAPDLWSLLREADAELPAGSSLTVFSPGRLAALRGTRPALAHCRVEWVQTPDAPPVPASGHAGSPAPAGAPLITASILHDADRTAEVQRLSAALRTAAQVSGRTVNVLEAAAKPGAVDVFGPTWVFWLSTQNTPGEWAERGANVVSEETGSVGDPTASWIVAAPGAGGAMAFGVPGRLWQRVLPTAGARGAVGWTDGFGRPLLTMEREGRGRHWRFFGRFDPAWTELAGGSAFPAFVRALLFGPEGTPAIDPVNDRRLADPSQYRTAEPSSRRDGVTLQRAGDRAVDLHGSLWAIAAALFGLERFLAGRPRPRIAANPPPVAVATTSR